MRAAVSTDSDQKKLYIYNRSVLSAAEYTELLDIERTWIAPRCAELEQRAPAFSSHQELIDALRAQLRDEEEAGASEAERFLAEKATREQFTAVVTEFAVDGLIESQSHLGILPRLPGRARMAVLRVLIDEFGCGNDDQEHSALYTGLLAELGQPANLEYYVERASDECLAYVNLFHWLASRAPVPEYFLGAYAYFESSVLYAFRCYAEAATRLGIVNDRYYTEHLYIDTYHSKQMQAAIRTLGDERPVDLAKVWAGIQLTSQIVVAATEAAIGKARR